MNLIEITDINASELDIFARLPEVQLLRYYEPQPGVFLAESANVILRALETGYEPLSMLVETGRMDSEGRPVFECIKRLWGGEKLEEIPVYTAKREIVTQLTGYELVRGLWAVLRRKPVASLQEFCYDKKRITLLYDVVNPTNVGAIIRSAAALGMDGALLSRGSVDPLTRRATRVSMGTVFQMPWTVASKHDAVGAGLIRQLQSYGFQTAAMALTKDCIGVDDERLRAADRLAIVLGTEGTGLPDEVIDACDFRVMIPMYHGVDSLNVAAASAVCFWEVSKHSERGKV